MGATQHAHFTLGLADLAKAAGEPQAESPWEFAQKAPTDVQERLQRPARQPRVKGQTKGP